MNATLALIVSLVAPMFLTSEACETLGCVGRTLSHFATGTFTEAGALPVPRGFGSLRDTVFAACDGNDDATNTLAGILSECVAVNDEESARIVGYVSHIVACAPNRPAPVKGTNGDANGTRGSRVRARVLGEYTRADGMHVTRLAGPNDTPAA